MKTLEKMVIVVSFVFIAVQMRTTDLKPCFTYVYSETIKCVFNQSMLHAALFYTNIDQYSSAASYWYQNHFLDDKFMLLPPTSFFLNFSSVVSYLSKLYIGVIFSQGRQESRTSKSQSSPSPQNTLKKRKFLQRWFTY